MSIHHLPWDWTLWHIATRNLINKVNRRLEGRDITPPGFPKHDRLPGMIDLQRLCAAKVGDEETRAQDLPHPLGPGGHRPQAGRTTHPGRRVHHGHSGVGPAGA